MGWCVGCYVSRSSDYIQPTSLDTIRDLQGGGE